MRSIVRRDRGRVTRSFCGTPGLGHRTPTREELVRLDAAQKRMSNKEWKVQRTRMRASRR